MSVFRYMPATEAAIEEFPPSSWVEVAEWITYQFSREPLKSARGWEAHRAILGVLAAELEMNARELGEPTSMSDAERKRQWAEMEALYARMLGRVEPVPAWR